jgi:hypothetical protein
MSSTRSGYKKLGLEPIDPSPYRKRRARQQPMGDEKKDDGAGDPIKMLLEKALARQRNEMMGNFVQILRRLPMGEESSSGVHATPFKVQVNFDIPLFEGLIDADYIDKWLNLLKGYFSIHNFSDRENITFALLKVIPHIKDWWDTYFEQRAVEESTIFVAAPKWDSFRTPLKNSTTLLEATRTSTPDGPPCIKKGTKQYHASPIFSIPFAPN